MHPNNKSLLVKLMLLCTVSLSSGCSWFGDEEVPFLNTRVEDGLVILGSDPVIDNAGSTQKEVEFRVRDNRITYNSGPASNGYGFENASQSDRAKFWSDIDSLNKRLLKSLDFKKDPELKKANITQRTIEQLMKYYALDMKKYATSEQLRALKRTIRGALEGKTSDQDEIADFYLDGFNGESYEKIAASWYLLSARHGSTYSKYMMSILYQLGLGLPQDLAQSVSWYKKASEAMDSNTAKVRIAKRYLHPTSLIRDPKQAFVWMESAASQGLVEAQYLLADMYLQGRGVAKSPMDAATWYGKAAEQNSAYAQYSLGVMFYNGQGIGQNLLDAKKYLEYAAYQGHSEAQFLLARMYEQGFGVKKSLPEAYAWLKLVPRENIVMEGYDERVSGIIAQMTPDEILEADKLVVSKKNRISGTTNVTKLA